MTMSAKRERKRRYNVRLEFIARFEEWLASEPPMIRFRRWKKWRDSRPVIKDFEPE